MTSDGIEQEMLVAQIAAAIGTMCAHLPPDAREIAQGYFDDCHDDMRWSA